MPKEFLLKSQRKGFKRFWTPYIQEKFALLQQLEDKKQLALKNVTASVFNRFYSVFSFIPSLLFYSILHNGLKLFNVLPIWMFFIHLQLHQL